MQEAFQHGFEAYNKDAEETNQWQVLPDKDFYQSLETEGAEAYEAVNEDGQRVGGAIITANGNMGEPMEQREQSDACTSSAESRQRKTVGQLAFLYVKVGVQSKGIGQAIWRAIETMHPEIEVWETCTPYFDRRNIHFYINRCGFHAVEFLRPFGSKSDQRSSGRFAMRRSTAVWMGLPTLTTRLTWQVRQDSSCTRSDIKKYFARFVVLLLFIS